MKRKLRSSDANLQKSKRPNYEDKSKEEEFNQIVQIANNKRPRIRSRIQNEKNINKNKRSKAIESISDIENEPSNPTKWTQNDVYKFVLDLAGPEIANSFRVHEIDGQALEYLQMETMCQVLKLKLGCAARIKAMFDQQKKTGV